jgi:2,4-dichlorophenol 6-monooxygenase
MMTLLTGLGGQAWKNAAENLDLPYLRTVVIGEPGAADPYGYWRAVSEIHEAGAILVRPDGYVAWRHQGPVWDDAEASSALDAALDAVLAVSAARTASGEDAGAPQFSTAQVPITVPQAAPATEPALAGVETGRNQS